MRKPSIFSREYNKKMKKRKYNVIFSLISSLFIFTIICYIGIEKDFFILKNKEKEINSSNMVDEKEINIPEKNRESKSESYIRKNINLEDNEMVELILDNKFNIKSVEAPKFYEIDISPDKTKVLISGGKNQNNIIITNKGIKKDVSINKYTTIKGENFSKDKIINHSPDYIWSKHARFIDNNIIAYVTNRPYFFYDNLKQYIGLTNIETLENKIIHRSASTKIEFLNLVDKGIKVKFEDNERILTVNEALINYFVD